MLLLGQWPDEGVGWKCIDQMDELHPEVPAPFRGLSREGATRRIVTILQDNLVLSSLTPMRVTSMASSAIEERNADRTTDWEVFRMSHDDSFFGIEVPWGLHTPVLGPEGVADLITLSSIILESMQAQL